MAFSERELAPLFQRFLARHPETVELCVAFSGGMDSSVLLEICHKLSARNLLLCVSGEPLALSAIHVNHGLNPRANQWQQHCREQCEPRGIPLRCVSPEVKVAPGRSPEAQAREARYQCFDEHLQPGRVILTAHHLDDQMETLLLRLLRGAGPDGLAGIPESRSLGAGMVFRPLLGVSRSVLEEYATARGLVWIDDDSNADSAMDRNYLRHHVMPLLQARWPGYRQAWQQSAKLCGEAGRLNAALAERDVASARIPDQLHALSVSEITSLAPERQRNVLRHWLLENGCGGVGHQLLERIVEDVLPARQDAQPALCWQAHELRRYRDRLYLQSTLPELQSDCTGPVVLSEVSGCVPLPGNGELCPLYPGGNLELPPEARVQIRYRRDGETTRLAGQPGKTVKQLMQEAGIPPWLRHRLPMIEVDGDLAAIVGVGVCEGYRSAEEGAGWQFSWRLPPWHLQDF